MAIPYLIFNGRTEEALEFYRHALGAEVQMMMRFKDSPDRDACPGGSAPSGEKVMHSCVRIGGGVIMASDGMTIDNRPTFAGFSLSYDAKDAADAKRRFDSLAQGGKIEMPMGETFFAERFGVVTDKFGLSWMVISGAKEAK